MPQCGEVVECGRSPSVGGIIAPDPDPQPWQESRYCFLVRVRSSVHTCTAVESSMLKYDVAGFTKDSLWRTPAAFPLSSHACMYAYASDET